MLHRLRTLTKHIQPTTTTTNDLIRMSSTFTLPSPYPSVPVTIPSHAQVKQDQILNFGPFKKWIAKLNESLNSKQQNPDGYKLKGIDVTDVDMFGKKIGFLKVKADVKADGEEKSLPGVTLLRGPSVGLLVLLHVKGTPKDNLHAILALQPRIAGGTLSMAEIPAGMLDDAGSFSGAAAKELEQEVGLKIPSDQLIPLSQTAIGMSDTDAHPGFAMENEKTEEVDGYFSSVGLLDEVLTFHAYVHELEEGELDDWRGKMTGLRDEGEKITLKVVDFKSLWRETRDVKALCAWGLWTALKGEGKLDYYK